jgi:polar amino acid transport system permease protein
VDYRLIERLAPAFLQGLEMTLIVGTVSAVGAVLWGGLLVWPRIRHSRGLNAPIVAYIELVRNSPLLVHIYLLYFGLPLAGIWLPTFWCGVIAIVAQHGAFLCEIFRGGIEAIGRGQWEAGRAIGLRELKLFRIIILPQALLKIIPSITNQMVILVKDTSLVSAIGIMELTLMAKLSIERSAATFEVFIVVSVFYLLLTTAVGLAGRAIERHLRTRS